MKIASWNVNGLRAAKADFLSWVGESDHDIICLQEVKVGAGQLPSELSELPGYHSYYNFADKKGYSGVAVYARTKPAKVIHMLLANQRFGSEGRALLLEFADFSLLNLYLPHGGRDQSKLAYKLQVYAELAEFIKTYSKPLVVAGDFNVAKADIDLARPRQNRKNIMFTPAEKEQLEALPQLGLVDSFRALHPNQVAYTWWPYLADCRARNIGWRIDYIWLDKNMAKNLKTATTRPEIMGSDHCPIAIEFDL